MKGSLGLNDNRPELGVRTDDVGGWWLQIDDRSPLVKYYQASFFMYQPPSCPGITQRMVRCGRLMICPSEPFTFCISPFTYYWDTPPLYGFTTQMVWVAIVTAELYVYQSKALLCFFFFLTLGSFHRLSAELIVPTANVDNFKYLVFELSVDIWRKKYFPIPCEIEWTERAWGYLCLNCHFCTSLTSIWNVPVRWESCHWDCNDMCNIVKQQRSTCSVLRDTDAYFAI